MQIATLADIEILGSVPLAERGWPTNTYALLQAAATRFGGRTALTWIADPQDYASAAVWSFEALLHDVTRAANTFHALGCGTEDVIAYLLPNGPLTHFALWGAEACGIAFAINPALSSDHILSLLATMKARVLVIDPGILSDAVRSDLERGLSDSPGLEVVMLAGEGAVRPEGVRVEAFEALLQTQPGDRLVSGRIIAPGDRSSCFCTGGTTGAPKIAVRTHAAEATDACMLAIVLEGALPPGSRAFCGLPMFHVNAILVTGLATWVNGVDVVLGGARGYRDPAMMTNFWKTVEHYGVNLFSGVPTIYSALLNVPIAGADVSSLRVAICGAAPMPAELFRRFERETGVRILEGYGLTETVCTATMNPLDGHRPVGSIGLPLPYQSIRIVEVDADGTWRACAAGEIGVIAISGPNIFEGYVDPIHNETAWVDMSDRQRWLNTGDLGRMDPDGHLWLAGRRKELIIRGGHNIDPRLIEEGLHSHPDVALAAAVGRPDAHAGEVPVAYVELRKGATTTEAELLAFAATAISERAAVPKAITILEALPTTAVGKLFKPALNMREVEATVRRELAALNLEASVLVALHPKTGLEVKVESVMPLAGDQVGALELALGRYAFKWSLNAPQLTPAS